MELTSVRSFFRDREQYIGKEVVTDASDCIRES